jgi:hypothetical protein
MEGVDVTRVVGDVDIVGIYLGRIERKADNLIADAKRKGLAVGDFEEIKTLTENLKAAIARKEAVK